MNTVKFNPGYKGLTIFLISLFLSFEYNYYINISIFLISILLMLYNKVKIKKLVFSFIPVFIMAGGIFFTGYLYSGQGIETDVTELTKIVVVIGNMKNGLELGARVLAYAGLGFLFVYTTDMKMFILSLMQQFHLPRNFAYGIMAAYNFIPIIQKEYKNMIYAYRARGIKRNFFMLPMLVTAVKSSENIALAMESKGFSTNCKRSEYIKLKVERKDYLLAIFLPLLILIVVINF